MDQSLSMSYQVEVRMTEKVQFDFPAPRGRFLFVTAGDFLEAVSEQVGIPVENLNLLSTDRPNQPPTSHQHGRGFQ